MNAYELSKMQKVALVTALALFDALLFRLDVASGEAISLQALFVIPVVVSGLLLGEISLVSFSILSTVLQVEAYKQSYVFGLDFPYVTNLAATLISMLVVGAVVLLAKHYRDLVRVNQERNVGRRLNEFRRIQSR